VPVILPVCKVPKTRPAIFFGVCVEISACDVGINPVNTPMNKRNKKSCQTEVANPINNIDRPSPEAEMMSIGFLPCLSPKRPQIGEKIKAVINVRPTTQPAQVGTYASEKLRADSRYNELNAATIVMLPATKTLAAQRRPT